MSCVKTLSLGQRSSSQSTLTVCAYAYVLPIISSGMVVLENYLALMIIKTRQCVLLCQRSSSHFEFIHRLK